MQYVNACLLRVLCVIRSSSLRRTDDSSRVVIQSVLFLNECDREASKMRSWTIRCCRAVKVNRCKSLLMPVTIAQVKYDDTIFNVSKMRAFCAIIFVFLGINSSQRVDTEAFLRWIYNRRSARPDGCSLC